MANVIGSESRSISIRDFIEAVASRYPISSASSDDILNRHSLTSSRVQKLGLALSGFAEKIHKGRIQIFGNSERSYLARLSDAGIRESFARLDKDNISCILATAGAPASADIERFCSENRIPLLTTTLPSSDAIAAVSDVLSDKLAPEVTIHGTLMEVFGIGVLLAGSSGIGKSECALDLITRGHRLIADDSVRIREVGDKLVGEAPAAIRDLIEIRGLGIINARELFGVSALALSAQITLCIEFTEGTPGSDRLALEPSFLRVLNSELQRFPLPVTPGRNLSTLVEAAVRVFVSRQAGAGSIEKLIADHDAVLEMSQGS